MQIQECDEQRKSLAEHAYKYSLVVGGRQAEGELIPVERGRVDARMLKLGRFLML